jgi:PIN domain nuclease of toxin-antitoxin system
MPEPASPAILLDTCAAIWLVNGDPMTAQSRAAIAAAQASGAGVHVSPISAWEIAPLVASNRLQLASSPATWFGRLVALPGMRLAAMPPELLMGSAFLPGTPPRDPADRIIAATARSYDQTIVTRDAELTLYAQAGHIVTIGC